MGISRSRIPFGEAMNAQNLMIILISLLGGITAVVCAYIILHWQGNGNLTVIFALLGSMMGGFGIANGADQLWQELQGEE